MTLRPKMGPSTHGLGAQPHSAVTLFVCCAGMALAHCMLMERSNLIVDGDDDTLRYAALLKLRRGAASGASWGFNSADIGAIISVGASSECDWQVAAPGVPPLSLLFTGKALLVRSDDLHDKRV